jgi:hypothetical protein
MSDAKCPNCGAKRYEWCDEYECGSRLSHPASIEQSDRCKRAACEQRHQRAAVNHFDDLVGLAKDIINASNSPMGTAYELPRVQAYARLLLARIETKGR